MAETPPRDPPQQRHHSRPEVPPSSHGQRTSKRRPPQDPPLIIGGKYARGNEIGRGSFAVVYQGVHNKYRSFVAIKSVNRSKLNKKLKVNLDQEIDILKHLHHPHIVALLDCVEDPSEIHLVMEYCGLGDLAMFIKRRDTLGQHFLTRDMVTKYPNPRGGCLNEVFIRHFLKQFASALQFLRQAHLIHRDIKPQNLLLNPSPDMFAKGLCKTVPYQPNDDSLTPMAGLRSLPMLKIADFGFARSLPATSLADTLCGSPLYMAPEILKFQKYDAKADIWSVGAVAYEMVVGKPPFKAANHVELLQRIERQKDRIKFPEACEASDEMKDLIKALLKQGPTERMSYEDLFNSSVIKDEIPGLHPEDRKTLDIIQKRTPLQEERAEPAPQPAKLSSSPSQKGSEQAATSRPQSGNYAKSAGHVRRVGSRDKTDDLQRAAVTARRASTANQPGREARERTPESVPMERERSRNTSSPGSSFLKERATEELTPPKRKQSVTKDAVRDRERVAQDVAFERDYVVVEKRAVEMNAFADELAASPRIPQPRNQSPPSQDKAVVRRPPTGTSPQSQSPNLGQVTANRTMQIAGRPRADSSHQRQNSYERRYGPLSATSAVSKALNMATGRLFGKGFSPPQAFGRGGRSPPLGYNPFPAYPTHDSLVVIGPGAKSHVPLNEDERTVQLIEDCATRSDVVYGFAEVKYKQLIPLTPSTQPEHAMQPGTAPAEGAVDSAEIPDGGLTVDAMVTLSEEALVLYVKVLALLAKSMDIAGSWWARKNRGEVIGDLSSPSEKASTAVAAAARVNSVVQWIRARFNEVLEKAEYVRLKLSENQCRLPTDHPSHPNSHPVDAELAAGLGASVNPVFVSSGVTAEKLMYDRALEMSRSAAINELTGEDLAGCELSYTTAIMMLEAVLEDEEEDVSQPTKSEKPTQAFSDKDHQKGMGDNALGIEDREMVVKLVASIRTRLTAIRKKLAMLANRTLPPGAAASPRTATPQHQPSSPAVQPTSTPQPPPASPKSLPAQLAPSGIP